jgi:hypothetical protein
MKYAIYMVTTPTGKVYCGKHRLKGDEKGYLGSGVLIKASVKKYGKEAHIKEQVFVSEDYDLVNKAERCIIRLAKFVYGKKCLNIQPGGDGVSSEFMVAENKRRKERGWVYPEEAAKRSAEKNRGKSSHNKGKIEMNKDGNRLYARQTDIDAYQAQGWKIGGLPKTADHNRKNSEAHKGIVFSDDWKQHIRDAKLRESKQLSTRKAAWWASLTDEERAENNRKNSEAQKQLPIQRCPHCGLETRSVGNLKRHHLDNCPKKGL